MSYPKAIAYRGEVGRGGTLPQFFSVEELQTCVVKFLQNPQGPKALTNELVGFEVADVLGLEHPKCGVVEVEAEALPQDGTLEVLDGDGEPCVFLPGLAFYSQWLRSVDHLAVDDLAVLGEVNGGMLAGVVLLDLLLDNWDRTVANPNLLLERHGRQRLSLIDLGLAFGGPVWELGNLLRPELLPLEKPLPYAEDLEKLLKTVNPVTDFSPYLAKLSELSRARLESIVGNIPSEWGISPRERSALVDYLYTKAQAMPDYLERRLKKQEWWR